MQTLKVPEFDPQNREGHAPQATSSPSKPPMNQRGLSFEEPHRIPTVPAIKQEAKLDLNRIITELKTERARIGRAIAAVVADAKVAVSGGLRRAAARKRRRGGITAAGRRRLSQVMKRRWAERRMGKTTGKSAAPKRRGGLTAAGRKKLSEAMKKRWAEKKKTAS